MPRSAIRLLKIHNRIHTVRSNNSWPGWDTEGFFLSDMETAYIPDPARYDHATFRRCGNSGLVLPAITLGLWQNFGGADVFETGRAMIRRAFDRGVTHFDLANNYGPPYGSAEENFGTILRKDFRGLRNELVISSKAGWDMWPGPYGIGGSRKYLLASLDDSLKRMGLDYVDIFYAHRPWKDCPLEETMGALVSAVHQGKALYVGISSYSPERTRAGRQDSQEHGRAAAHPPAVLLHAESLDRERPARHARRTRRRMHRVFAARAGPAHQQIFKGRAERFARQARKLLAAQGIPERRKSQARPRAQRHCADPRPDARANGHRLGAARPARNLSAHRRAQRRAARRLARRAQEAQIHVRRAQRNRPSRAATANSTFGATRAKTWSKSSSDRRPTALQGCRNRDLQGSFY